MLVVHGGVPGYGGGCGAAPAGGSGGAACGCVVAACGKKPVGTAGLVEGNGPQTPKECPTKINQANNSAPLSKSACFRTIFPSCDIRFFWRGELVNLDSGSYTKINRNFSCYASICGMKLPNNGWFYRFSLEQ